MSTMSHEVVRNVDRAIDMLYALSQEKRVGVRELARRLNMSKSTVQRILASLECRSLVTHDPVTQHYRIGAGVIQLASSFLQEGDLVTRATPHLQKLRDKTGETVCLHTCVEFRRVTVLQVESPRELRWTVEIGRPYPLHVGCSGKLLMAYLPESTIEEYLRATPLEPLTSRTITNIDQLRADLQQIRNQGYAISFGERVAGGAGISAPVFDASGQVIAAISVYGPDSRLTRDVIAAFLGDVCQTAGNLSADLGYRKADGSSRNESVLPSEATA